MNAFATYAPIVIATIALLISMLSLRISRQKHQREMLAERPTATAEITPTGQPGWLEVSLRVINRSSVGQQWDDIRVVKPTGCLLLEVNEKLRTKDPITTWKKIFVNPLPVEQASARLKVGVRLKETGKEAPAMNGVRIGYGDNHFVSFLVFVPPSQRRKRLSIRVSLRSMEPVERSSLIDIKRTALADTSTAKDKISGTN